MFIQFDSFLWLLILFSFLLVYLWMFSTSFRYYVRIGAVGGAILVISYPLSLICLSKPWDASTFRIGGWMLVRTLSFLKIKWNFRGEEKLKSIDGPCIIICNEQSMIDLVGMTIMWPDRCVPMVKKELWWCGGCGAVAYITGSVFIDRFNRQKAIQTCDKTLEYIKRRNLKLWIFPEGTRGDGEEMLPFKKGAFHMAIKGQIPIIPIVFSSYKSFYSTKEKKFLIGGHVIVEILDAIPTEGLNTEDVNGLLAKCRGLMTVTYWKLNKEVEEIGKEK